MHDAIGIPACFSAHQKPADHDPSSVIRSSGQSLVMSVYRTKLAGKCRLITIPWCKNLLLHGLSVSVQSLKGADDYSCKVELKPWNFWRKNNGAKHFTVDGVTVNVVWNLKAAKFNGETEPQSDYYVAFVCEEEVVLLVGDKKKDSYRKTRCRPSLIDPIMVLRKEHLFGKKKYLTGIKFDEKFLEIFIECKSCVTGLGCDAEMEIKIDGNQVIHVKNLQWNFRGNENVDVNESRVEVCRYDVHDWLFGSGPRCGMFIFKPISTIEVEDDDKDDKSSGFSLLIYAWKVE